MEDEDLKSIIRHSKARRVAIHPTTYLEMFGNHPNGVTIDVDGRIILVLPAFHIGNLKRDQVITETVEDATQ